MAKPEFRNHPKFLKACRLLGEIPPHVYGYIEFIWATGCQLCNALVGDADDVETVANYPGEPGKLVRVLVECRLLDEIDDGKFAIHDFFDHCPEYVITRAKRTSERQISKRCEHCGREYRSSDLRSRYCTPSCRTMASRRRTSEARLTDVDGVDGPSVNSVNTPKMTPKPDVKVPLNSTLNGAHVDAHLLTQTLQNREKLTEVDGSLTVFTDVDGITSPAQPINTNPPNPPKGGRETNSSKNDLPDLILEEFISAWNALPKPFPQIRSMSPGRRRKLAARYKESFFKEHWRTAIAEMPKRGFLAGGGDRQWVADIDFFLKPDTVTKIIEGAYGSENRSLAGAAPVKTELELLHAGRTATSAMLAQQMEEL